MKINDAIDICERYVAKGNFNRVASLINKILPPKNSQRLTLTVCATRWNKLYREKNASGMTNEEFQVEFNKINTVLLKLLKKYRSEISEEDILDIRSQYYFERIIRFDNPDEIIEEFLFDIYHKRNTPFSFAYHNGDSRLNQFFTRKSFEYILAFTNYTDRKTTITNITLVTKSFVPISTLGKIVKVSTLLGIKEIPKFFIVPSNKVNGVVEILKKEQILEIEANSDEKVSIEIDKSANTYGFYELEFNVLYYTDSIAKEQRSHKLHLAILPKNHGRILNLTTYENFNSRPIQSILNINDKKFNQLVEDSIEQEVYLGNTPVEYYNSYVENTWKLKTANSVDEYIEVSKEETKIYGDIYGLDPEILEIIDFSTIKHDLKIPFLVNELNEKSNPIHYRIQAQWDKEKQENNE